MPTTDALSQRVLLFDSAFLLLSGTLAMILETVGHFFGVGPFAETEGSPYTIRGFEAPAHVEWRALENPVPL